MKIQANKFNPQYALELYQQGKLCEAETVLNEVLQQLPTYAYGWFLLGIIHAQNENNPAAKEALIKAVDNQKIYPEAYNNLGVIYEKLNQPEKARDAYLAALNQKPDYANALYNVANIFQTQGETEQAIDYYHRALKLDPNYVNALTNLGVTYQFLRNQDKALQLFNRALLIAPNDVALLNNVGLCHYYQFNYHKALDYFQKALNIAPGLSSAYMNIAQVMQSTGDHLAARQYFERSAKNISERETALSNIALLELGNLNFKEGWEYYRHRISIQNGNYQIPENLPADLAGIKIMLCKDQGLGDEIFFLRFIDTLIQKGAKVTYFTDSRLQGILERSLKHIKVTDSLLHKTNFDFVLPVSELPRLLLTHLTTPTPLSVCLKPAQSNLATLQNLIPRNNKPNIAVSWQAGTSEANRLYKRIDPELLGNLLRNVDANVLILQRNPGKTDIKKLEKSLGRKAFNFSYINDNLDDTLAFLALVDDYITVSNTNAHLMAGLQRSAKILVPHPPEWRWTFSQNTSPWFPEFALYRQDSSGNWQHALKLCQSHLTPPVNQ